MGKSIESQTIENPRQRAEDILLGGLGYSDDASIVRVERKGDGFCGVGRYKSDQSEFEFASEDPLSNLERWALSVLIGKA